MPREATRGFALRAVQPKTATTAFLGTLVLGKSGANDHCVDLSSRPYLRDRKSTLHGNDWAPHMNDIAVSLLEPLAAVATSPRSGALVVLLVAAAVIDYRTFRIPNWLTLGGTCLALALAALLSKNGSTTLLLALGGLATGFVVMLPLYAVKVMGAGDVKLMAMAGAFLGMPDTLHAVLYTFITGGVAALAFAISHRVGKRMAANVRDMVQSMAFAAIAGKVPGQGASTVASVGRLPYGVSIAVGTIAYVLIKQVGRG